MFARKLKGQRQGNRQGTGWAKATVGKAIGRVEEVAKSKRHERGIGGKATETMGKTIGSSNDGHSNTEIIR